MPYTMNIRRYIPDHAATTSTVLAALFAVHYFLLRDEPMERGIEMVPAAPSYYEHWQWVGEAPGFDIDTELARLQLDDAGRDRQIRALLRDGRYQHARTLLLEIAAAAVARNDRERLGDTLLLLGEVAINQQELAAAEIYLQEALYLSIESDDVLATARGYRLLGQLNLRARELARRAAVTYDELWQARNLTARGLYHGVGDSLHRVIRENLEIRRYGAAADAWEALAALHDKLHDAYQAQRARIEAARLFATTGQMSHVRRLLDGLDRSLMTRPEFTRLEGELDSLFQTHQQDLIKTSQAHDYRMLYHHYLRRGERERAWQFRIKASETLADTSDRALFQRQSDVIAVLYNSNFAMQRARDYLRKAGAIYDDAGAVDGLEQTRDLESLIY